GGVLRGVSLTDGSAIRTAYHRLALAPGWHVWVNEPETSFSGPRRAVLLPLATGALLALGLGVLGAVLLARRLLKPVEALVARAEQIAAGNVPPDAPAPTPPAGTAEFERLRLAVEGAEAVLRRIQRIGRVGGFEIDLRTGTNRRSAEYMALQGLPAIAAQESHADWVRRLHPEDRARAEQRFLDAISDGAPDIDYAQEYRILTPEGEVRWIYARAEIERDASGRTLRMVGAHVDVTALKQAEAALRHSEERLRLALEAAQLGAWEVDFRTGAVTRTARALEIFGFPPDYAEVSYPSWRDRVHPDDRAAYTDILEDVRAGRIDSYRTEFRFRRPDGTWIWIETHGRAVGDDPETGRPTRLIGTMQDITARKEVEERQTVLVHELDHRAKNTLAVVQAALRLTPRTDAGSFARAVEGRVGALARAHTLLAKARWSGAALRTVAEEALVPFLDGGAAGPRATCHGPAVPLSPAAVQALSMAFHELATNAAKHGALSVPAGRVELRWRLAPAAAPEELVLSWSESGGPPVPAPPAHRGFGSSLVAATVTRQLGGRITTTWRADGLLWEAWLPLARLAAGSGEAGPPLPGAETAEPAALDA
uniref:sensor histidine kinase n=1 Tax=Falsiroseomonas oryzae TaxID=2766473 RepID=UPI0022EA1C56